MGPCSYDQRFQTIAGMETFINSWGRPISWVPDTEWGADGTFKDGSGDVVYITTNGDVCSAAAAAFEEKGYLVQEHWMP